MKQGSLPERASKKSNQYLYDAYVKALEDYVKKPTVQNWENKEKAFEVYSTIFEVDYKDNK